MTFEWRCDVGASGDSIGGECWQCGENFPPNTQDSIIVTGFAADNHAEPSCSLQMVCDVMSRN